MNSQIPMINIENSDDSEKSRDLYAAREKIYVRRIKGFFQQIRSISLSLLFAMYFGFAWINIGDKPMILFDLAQQKFYLFGAVFWPQDFTLLAFALIICAFGLFFITALFGRVWCGYSCPQTAWSLMFIWLEEFFEGSRNQRIKLDQQRASLRKWLKKGGKHASWMLLALATAITFVGYFYPIRELTSDLLALSLASGWAWFWIGFFTLATYLNAGWLREQVCIYMCPYARFQSTMFNENTLIVGYDKARGEPRGSRSRHHEQGALGDCIDCQMCVQVCPVGIDIRDGLQYECIGCALCIDACDSIMDKLHYSKGLIRYASEKEFQQGAPNRKLDARAIGYGLVLFAAISVFITLMLNRPQAELSVLRDRGALYYETGLGKIENFYTLKLVNKREHADTFSLSILPIDSEMPLKVSVKELAINGGEVRTFPVSIEVDPADIHATGTEIEFIIRSDSEPDLRFTADSKFLGPAYRL